MKNRPMIRVLFAATLLFLINSIFPHYSWAEPFIGEIRWVSFNFAPKGWAMCNGQLLPINQNQALFSLLGTTFGGNGQTTFALPDMRSRAPIHVSTSPSYPLGSNSGKESHILTLAELPIHNHVLKADPKEGTTAIPTGNYPAKTGNGTPAYAVSSTAAMAPASVANTGASLPHDNMKPYITMNCIIALQGIFPSRP